MIWVDGRIIPDEDLSISILDRTFEHGLGLFETFRTWGGRPTLLGEHKARMLRSAGELGIPIDPASLPGFEDVFRLLEAEGFKGDRMLRITASGGTTTGRSMVWMRSAALPPATGAEGASLVLDGWSIAHDALARHKTLNYWTRRRASEEARRRGIDESLGRITEGDGRPTYYEGSRTNLFVVFEWRFGTSPTGTTRPILLTPSEAGPIVPGIMRRLVLDVAAELPVAIQEVESIEEEWFEGCGEVFLTNSVRGIIPVGRATVGDGVGYRWPAPGRWTRALQERLARRLWPDRGESP